MHNGHGAKRASTEIETLIRLLAKLPGLGPRSARRAALALISKRESLMLPLAGAMGEDSFVAQVGFALLWIAALLTAITGWDYFRKAQPLLREDS